MTRPSPTTPIALTARCPCGLGLTYGECCAPLHRGATTAATAEQLMRSRFSAYTTYDGPYLLRSWHPDTRPRNLRFDPVLRWTRLEILGSTGGGLFDTEGTVRFRAHYIDADEPGTMEENSRFVRHHGIWVYVSALGTAAASA